MPQFIVYEIWTASKLIEADNIDSAYLLGEPGEQPPSNLGLSNWHVKEVIKPNDKLSDVLVNGITISE